MCRLDLCNILVAERIPSSLPLSRALRFQRYEQQNRNRQEERQSWANFISYLRAQEHEQKQTMQMQMQAHHWMADTMSGGATAATLRPNVPASASAPAPALAPSILVESAAPSYGAIRHRRAHQEHVALNVQPRRRAAQSFLVTAAAAQAEERANALTDSVIHTLFAGRTIPVSVDDEKAASASSVQLTFSEESINVNVPHDNFVLVLVDELDEKKMELMQPTVAHDTLALQQSLTVLQQQLNNTAARSAAVAFSASDYLDAALLVRNRTVEVAD